MTTLERSFALQLKQMPGSQLLFLSAVALATSCAMCTSTSTGATDEGNLNGAYVLSETGPHPGSHKTNEKFPTQFKASRSLRLLAACPSPGFYKP